MKMARANSFGPTLRLSSLSMALLLGSTSALAADKIPRVVGGTGADPGQFPWQVALVGDGASPYDTLQCGGSIINERWILTAAHCAGTDLMTVVVGASDLTDTSAAQILTVKQWIVHPDYVDADFAQAGEIGYDNDVALIELETPIDFAACGSNCATIDVVTPENETSVMALSSSAYVSGWGETVTSTSELSYYPPDLQWATLSIVSCTESPSLYVSSEISNNMFCAGVSDFSKDTCQGDSGGPLVVLNESGTGYVQAGVVSWGSGCAVSGYPGVYTRLSQYQRWIWDTTNGACCSDPGPLPPTEPPVNPVTSGGGGGGGGGSLSWLMLLALPVLSLRKRPGKERHA